MSVTGRGRFVALILLGASAAFGVCACGGDRFTATAGGSGGVTAAGSGGLAAAGSGGAAAGGSGGVNAGGAGGAVDSPAVPKDGLVFWYSGDVGVTETSGAVSKWVDRSGNTGDARQLVPELRPKKGSLGGLPAIEFDGQDDHLVIPPLAPDFTEGVSFFAVARPTEESACAGVVELSNGSEIQDIGFNRQSDSLAYEIVNQSTHAADGAFAVGESRLLEVVHTPAEEVALWLDGVSSGLANFTLPETATRDQTFIGRSLYVDCVTFKGQIAEVLLYSRALSRTERQAMEHYLQTKWGCCGG